MNDNNEQLIKIKKVRKKMKILIVSTEDEYRDSLINKLIDYNSTAVRRKSIDDHEEFLIEYEYKNRKYYSLIIDSLNNSELNIKGINIFNRD